tara:strand:- start:23 stop:403 length:381 start_codon:yes stop_codon:yes gene_type:complete
MAHFAEINEENIVTQVIVVHNNELLVGEEESEEKGIDFCESLYGHRNWVQTSYNNNIRYNYAGVGYTWDPDNNAFYEPQPYPSWSLNEDFKWEAPVPYPENVSEDKIYTWDEENQEWKVTELTIEE